MALTTTNGLSYAFVGGQTTAKIPVAHDATHLASIGIKVSIAKDDNPNHLITPGTYYVSVAVASPGRLNTTKITKDNQEADLPAADQYVQTNATLYYQVVVGNNGTFTALSNVTGAYLSATGTEDALDDETVFTANDTDWTFGWLNSTEYAALDNPILVNGN